MPCRRCGVSFPNRLASNELRRMTDRSDARLVHSLTAFCAATSLFTIATGMAALLGWSLRIEVLRTWRASPIGTQPITSVCLILLGVSLWLLRRTPHAGLPPAQRFTAYATAGLAGVWGALGCMEHLPGFGLSPRLLGATTLGASAHLERMSPVCALDLFLFGLALVILDWRPRPRLWPAQVLCFLGGMVSLAVLLDYVLDPGMLRTVASLPSAIVFAAFSLAAVCARPEWGIAALFASQSLGGTVLRRLFFTVVVVPVLISWIRWRSLQFSPLSHWAVITVTSVALLSGLVIWTATIIERVDGKRIEASLRLQASQEQMRLLLDGIKDYAIYRLDPEGRVASWNEGGRRIEGYQTEEILGEPMSRFYTAEDVAQDKPQQALREAISSGRHETRGLRVRKDGSRFWASVTITPFYDESGTLRGFSKVLQDVSERRQMEEALLESKAQLSGIITSAMDAIIAIDSEHRIVLFNPAAEKMFGISAQEVTGGLLGRLIPERFRTRHAEHIRRFGETGVTNRSTGALGELRGLRADSEEFPIEASISQIQSGGKKLFTVIVRDITARRQAEEALRISEQRYRRFVEHNPVGVLRNTLEGKILECNDSLVRMLGYSSRQELLSCRTPDLHFDPTDREMMLRVLQRHKILSNCEIHFRCKDGTALPTLASIMLVEDEPETGAVIESTIVDIAERKRAEEAMQRSEEQLRLFVEHAPAALAMFDREMRYLWASRRWQADYGLGDRDLRGVSHYALFPDISEQWKEAHRRGLAGEVLRSESDRFERADGSVQWIRWEIRPWHETKGEIGGIVIFVEDITERRQAEERLVGQTEEVARQAEELARSEEALRAQTNLLQSVLDSLDEGLIAADDQGKFFLWNPAAEKILGSGPANISPAEWAQHYGIYLPDETTPFPTDQFPLLRAAHGESATAEMFVRNSQRAEPAWIEVSGRPLKSEDGTVRGGVVAFRDVTEPKAAQEIIRNLNDELEQRVLQRTAELEAANQELQAFSYSVSHDLRAPLRHIGGFSKLLVEEFGPKLEPEAQHYLQRIEEGTRHMGQLVDELLNLARVGRHELSLQITGLNSIVQDVVTTLQPETEGRQVEWKIADLPFVECDPVLVKQVFQNLLANALKFTRPREQTVIEVSPQEANGEPVILVRDNGVGFSMKYSNKLFGVFQRLHRAEDFEGTGVGLATVQRIIQKHGGRVWAKAELDRGATFYFTLGPAADKPVETEQHSEVVGA